MTIRSLKFRPDYDVAPQAIIWRPLRYFTMNTRVDSDGLDEFEGASFEIGNQIRFDLRTYRGHPGVTVTFYLPEGLDDATEIKEAIDLFMKEMLVPKTAIAWRRGQEFQFGELHRPIGDRLREPEARVLVLKIAAQQENHSASTEFLKKEVPKYTDLSEKDRQKSLSRNREELWQQIVGNIVSHINTRQGPFAKGYAVRTPDGIAVTKKGLIYLNSIGFSEFSLSDFDE